MSETAVKRICAKCHLTIGATSVSPSTNPEDQYHEECFPYPQSEPPDHTERWYVVYRDSLPIAAFVAREFAQDWISQAPHRISDTIAVRRITFKGIEGYERNPRHE